jgi:hypothetical protein
LAQTIVLLVSHLWKVMVLPKEVLTVAAEEMLMLTANKCYK